MSPRWLAVWVVVVGILTSAGTVSAQIKEPGAHPDYSVELEPHLLLQWTEGPDWHHNVGPGLGFRATIPFFHNGPIEKLNNNMGITFGLDTAFYSGCEDHWGPHGHAWWANHCSGMDWTFPIAMQWNFWLTPVISVYGEPGFAMSYETGSFDAPCPGAPGGLCHATDSRFRLEPVIWGGARFLVSDSVGILLRAGIPSISVGVGILL
jgi:hypothetical protein